jgi:transposase
MRAAVGHEAASGESHTWQVDHLRNADSSPSAGWDPYTSEERITAPDAQLRCATQAEVWSEAGQKILRELPLEDWAAQRRQDSLNLLGWLNPQITQLEQEVERAAHQHPRACLLMTQPGVRPVTALAYVVTMGNVTACQRGKQVASYLGLIPSEHSSSKRRRLGSISKQGNPFLRMLLVKSVQTVCRLDEGFRKQYQHRCHRMKKAVAKVAAARKLAVPLFWMLRTNTVYPEIARIESSPRDGVVGRS